MWRPPGRPAASRSRSPARLWTVPNGLGDPQSSPPSSRVSGRIGSNLTSKSAGDELNLRPRHDDVPIEGRILGLEGRPVPGVNVDVIHIWNDAPDFLKRAQENGGEVSQELFSEGVNGLILEEPNPNLHARTDRDGRFRLTGVGRDRRVTLVVHGDSIDRSYAMIYTTRDPAYKPLLLPVDESDNSCQKILGPRFDLTVAPGRVIEGAIRDAETGRPVPGARIRSWEAGSSTSDAQGRFRLTGHPMNMKTQDRIEVVVDRTDLHQGRQDDR